MSNAPPSSIFRRYRLSQAAADGMMVTWHCFYCRRRRTFWAADLVTVYADQAVEEFGNWCGKCGRSDGVSVHTKFPSPDDAGRIKLLRPIGWVRHWHWGTEWLELPVRALPSMEKPATATELEMRKRPPATPVFEPFGVPVGYETPRRGKRR